MTLLDQVLICEKSYKKYKIQPAELKFYQQMDLPIPRQHYDARHQIRHDLRNSRTLYQRQCTKTGVTLMTTYSPDRPEPIVSAEIFKEVIN